MHRSSHEKKNNLKFSENLFLGFAFPIGLRLPTLYPQRAQSSLDQRVHHQTDAAGRLFGEHGQRRSGGRRRPCPGAKTGPNQSSGIGRARKRTIQRVYGPSEGRPEFVMYPARRLLQ